MLNLCGLIKPISIALWTVILLSILAPVFFERTWPYIAAAGVLAVPILVYRWWNTRYNPGCTVRYLDQPEA
ncbi:MAG: hypothetical protein M9934_14280 [Thermomicrobiales bacterium]|nr:hypothetical protein [Thermomicrobiales bacterium]MCO5229432.1 hypothetical protein [Thermomicrobiales bacterium]